MRRGLTAGLAIAAVMLVVFAVAWSPSSDPEPLLVADLRGHALLVVDPAEPEAARRIGLPGGPHEMLRLPDGRVLVSLEQSAALVAVEVESGSIEVIEVGGLPHGLALDGGTVLVTDRSVDAVRRFTLDGWEELAPLEVGAWPHAVAVLPDGGVAVTSAEPGSVILDGVEVHVGRTTETLAVRSDGAVATAAATDGTVMLLAPDGAVLGRWDVGGRPVRVAFSPDEATLAVALSAGHAVALIDTASVDVEPGAGDAVRVARVEGVPDGLVFSSDGRVVYASDVYGGAVTAVDVASGGMRAVLRPGEGTGTMLVAGH